MVEHKDTDIKYIRSEENPADIMTKSYSKDDYIKHTKRITQEELCNLVETVR